MNPVGLFIGLLCAIGLIVGGGIAAVAATRLSMVAAAKEDRGPRIPREKDQGQKDE